MTSRCTECAGPLDGDFCPDCDGKPIEEVISASPALQAHREELHRLIWNAVPFVASDVWLRAEMAALTMELERKRRAA